jgi:homoserine dehydrogenase
MKQVRIALVGFGNVGQAFAGHVKHEPQRSGIEIFIAAVADSSCTLLVNTAEELGALIQHKQSGLSLNNYSKPGGGGQLLGLLESFQTNQITALVECLPTNIATGEPGLGLIKAALSRGLNVVTVDKGPIVHGFEELARIASETDARLEYSGTMGIGIPEGIRGQQVLEIRGILNGTTNHILTEMQERSLPFGEALAQAQWRGIAEPDASLDVEGWDTAAKILILAKSLMAAGTDLTEVSRIGIGSHTEALIKSGLTTGRKVRLVGRARIWQGRVRVSVAPKLIGPESPLYAVAGTSKAAIFRTAEEGEVVAVAKSSRNAICRAIAEDLARVANHPHFGVR